MIPRTCADCLADISARHHSARRCKQCAAERERNRNRARARAQAQKPAFDDRVRAYLASPVPVCRDCHEVIPSRLLAVPIAKPHRCAHCAAALYARGGRALH